MNYSTSLRRNQIVSALLVLVLGTLCLRDATAASHIDDATSAITTTAKTLLSNIRGTRQRKQSQDELKLQQQKRREQEQCVELGTQTFDFYITLDENPTDTVYSLICDDGITYMRSQSFSSLDAYQSFHERVCLPAAIEETTGMLDYMTLTCVLTIADSVQRKDGLTAGAGGKFEVYEDGQLINSYDGANGGPMFEVYTVCCGQNCGNYQPTLPPLIVSNIEGTDATPCDDDYLPDDDIHPEFKECQDLSLTFKLDNHPGQTGYSLKCDNEMIWNKPIGTFNRNNALTTISELQSCVAKTSTCVFTVFDREGDGLGNKGSFLLTYGTTIVADYDGSSPDNAFTQISFCLGKDCSYAPPADASSNTDSNYGNQSPSMSDFDCPPVSETGVDEAVMMEAGTNHGDSTNLGCTNLVQLFLNVDEFPNELSYTLDCSGELVWDKPPGTYLPSEAFGSFQESVCVDDNQNCCTFTIRDTWGDGITSPERNIPGSFELRWGGTSAGSYDGSDSNSEFSELKFQMGPGC
jgi:hypothetical protein